MKALLLNSGAGSRMGALTREKPKCMTEIGGGYTIISRQLTQLAQGGVRDVVLTTGPFADVLRVHVDGLGLGLNVEYVHNPAYATTNYILSMHLAAPLLTGADVLLLHGDLVLEDSVLADLLQSTASVMTTDTTLPLPEKDFKARMKDGCIVAVGVDFFGGDCVACQPAYRWLPADFGAWLDSIASFITQGNNKVYGENALNALHGRIPLLPLELGGRLCNEIDNPEDLATVSARFLKTLGETPAPILTEGGIR